MSAMAAAGLSRSKTFEIASASTSGAASYFDAINTLVNEFRYDYPEACRLIGIKAKSENMQSFLLRFSDALRSGEQLSEFLAREAEVQGDDYQNVYERDLESVKQWTNAFTSLAISVALIIIIQIISSMLYSVNLMVMVMSVSAGALITGFGAYLIYRSAPQEIMTLGLNNASPEHARVQSLFRILIPIGISSGILINATTNNIGIGLVWTALCFMPVGIISLLADRKMLKKDQEFSTFLRSSGGMATASGTTLKQALTKIDLSSFPMLQSDISRLSARLNALVDPQTCWEKFGRETGSALIHGVTDIFYSGIRMGGDPERVGYLSSLFALKTSQLRAKRRLIAQTFAALATVMQVVITALMIFVFSIVQNFATAVAVLMPESDTLGSTNLSLGMAEYSAADLQFLYTMTVAMVLLLAISSAAAIVLSDGGFKMKGFFWLAVMLLVSGICFLVIPPIVANILQI